jgi:hypothetical protein
MTSESQVILSKQTFLEHNSGELRQYWNILLKCTIIILSFLGNNSDSSLTTHFLHEHIYPQMHYGLHSPGQD